MKLELYNAIVKVVRSSAGSTRACNKTLRETFPSIPVDTLESILCLEYQKRMKRNHIKSEKVAQLYYNRYQDAIKSGQEPGALLRIAYEVDVAPALVARIVLEQHLEAAGKQDGVQVSKSMLTKLMKDTTLITDKDLAYEVFLCVMFDDQCGPVQDSIKHSLGQQYELKLRRLARERGILYQDEDQLQERGYDKTPDLKLEVPIAVDGCIVNWIESKALFGSPEAHEGYIHEQYLSYWNRFGPGLVIYWFGFLEDLDHPSEKRFIIRDDFPSNITYMEPEKITVP